MINQNTDADYPVLLTDMETANIIRLATILQAGFYRRSIQGVSVFTFLSSLPGFNEDYITSRLQTVFLDGDPVDKMNLEFSSPRATLALSAAMPGLAGSLFRKSTILTPLRKRAVQQQIDDLGGSVVVRVKLFNVIGVEKGPLLLSEGVLLDSDDLYSFLSLRPKLLDSMMDPLFNGEPISGQELFSHLKTSSKILLKCNTLNG